MNDFLEGCLVFSESILQWAREEMQKGLYSDAQSSAMAALDGFLMVKDDPRFIERAFAGLEEVGTIVVSARRHWRDSSRTPAVEIEDQLRVRIKKEIDDLDKSLRQAVRSALGAATW